MPKITIVDHFSQVPGEYGNNRFIYLADMLIDKGMEVEIFTSQFSHKEKRNRVLSQINLNEIRYRFHFFPEPGYTKNISLKRIYSHTLFGIRIYAFLKKNSYKTDLFYVAVPSLTAAALVSRYAKKHSIPVIVDIQDIWPQAFKLVFNPLLIGQIFYAPQMLLTSYINHNASAFVAVSETYLKTVSRYSVPKLTVFLGTDIENFYTYGRQEDTVSKPEGEFWIVYAGTLGTSYNLNVIFEALSKLDPEKHRKTVFKIMGDGPLIEKFKEIAKKSKIRVEFLGRIPYSKMIAVLLKSDVAVNPIADGAAQSIINKVADYAAAGLPVISTQGNPEYRNLVDRYQLGYNSRNDDPDGIAKVIDLWYDNPEIRETHRKNQLKVANQLFNRRQTYPQIVNLVLKLIDNN